MKIKIALLILAAVGAAVFFTVSAVMDRPPDGARRIRVEGGEAAAAAAMAAAMIEEAQKSTPRNFSRRYCANPNDSELGMFCQALREVRLASTEALAVEAFYEEPTRFNVFFALAEEAGRCQMVLRRDPDTGGWYFEKLYILP